MSTINRWKFADKTVVRAIRYLNGEIKVAPRFVNQLSKEKFSVNDGLLYYEGKQIVPESDVNRIITLFDANPATTGGRDRLHQRMQEKYIGISKTAVANFIANSTVHQLHKQPPKKVTIRSIVISKPGIYGQADLIDMQKHSELNNKMRYALTYIDNFSKYVEARGIPNKEVKTVIKAMDEILAALPPGTKPRTIQTDGGGEFATNFEKTMKSKHGIRVIHSSSYTPQAQGQIENTNGNIKRLLFQQMSRYGDSKRWIDLLPLVVTNINTAQSSTTKMKPIDLMRTKDPKIIAEVRGRIEKKAIKTMEGHEEPDLRVGQSVRVLLTSQSSVRKNAWQKSYTQRWSDKIYEIRSISKPENEFTRPRYLLQHEGKPISKSYWSYQLQPVNRATLIDDVKTIEERPVFDESKFDNERHLKLLSKRPTIPNPAAANKPATALSERKSRARTKSKKYNSDEYVK